MDEQQEKQTPPGYYECPWPAYPGHIKFRTPFLGAEYQAYIKAWNAPAPKDVDPTFWNQGRMKAWRAAPAIIAEWDIKDVPMTVLNDTGSNVPLGLISWAGQCLTLYLAPFLAGIPSPEPLTDTRLVQME